MAGHKILVVEDSDSFAELEQRAVESVVMDAEVRVVCRIGDVESYLREGGCELIISDFGLPGFNGRDVLRLRNELAPKVPFILITGSLSDETAVELLKLGVDDYLLKDRASRLPLAIKSVLSRSEGARDLEFARIRSEQNAARFRNLFEVSSDLIFMLSPEGRLLDYNPAFKEKLEVLRLNASVCVWIVSLPQSGRKNFCSPWEQPVRG